VDLFLVQFLTPESFLELFLLVGRNGQGVGTSPFATWVGNVEKLDIDAEEKKEVNDAIDNIYSAMDRRKKYNVLSVFHLYYLVNFKSILAEIADVGHFLDNEGSALYPLQSWVNHSCVANTEVKFPFKNHILGLQARRDIQAGEEITISYLDLGDLERSRYARNKYLK